MDTRTLFVVALMIAVICIISFILFFRRNSRRLSKQVMATVTKIEVEATSISSGWVITAQWSDMQSGQIITFRSHRLQFPPRLPIGGPVTVYVDPRNPTHFHMEL